MATANQELERVFAVVSRGSSEERTQFLDTFLGLCEPDDLMHMSRRLDALKRDFICLLPLEVVEIVLNFLDTKSLLSCCQVSHVWNYKLSKYFNKLWFDRCYSQLSMNELTRPRQYCDELNYKHLFTDIMQRSNSFDRGAQFRNWSVGPADINAIGLYKNILATGKSLFD